MVLQQVTASARANGSQLHGWARRRVLEQRVLEARGGETGRAVGFLEAKRAQRAHLICGHCDKGQAKQPWQCKGNLRLAREPGTYKD